MQFLKSKYTKRRTVEKFVEIIYFSKAIQTKTKWSKMFLITCIKAIHVIKHKLFFCKIKLRKMSSCMKQYELLSIAELLMHCLYIKISIINCLSGIWCLLMNTDEGSAKPTYVTSGGCFSLMMSNIVDLKCNNELYTCKFNCH